MRSFYLTRPVSTHGKDNKIIQPNIRKHVPSLLCENEVIKICCISTYSGVSRSLVFFNMKMQHLKVKQKKSINRVRMG